MSGEENLDNENEEIDKQATGSFEYHER